MRKAFGVRSSILLVYLLGATFLFMLLLNTLYVLYSDKSKISIYIDTPQMNHFMEIYVKTKPNKSIMELRRKIQGINEARIIYNVEKYGNVSSSTPVIIVQVHDRLNYLKSLIHSLSMVRDIDTSLIIFSHDLWREDINQAIHNKIVFAKFMQIYYPYSIQLYPNEFPGTSPDDCHKNISKINFDMHNCKNKQWPDKYGNYRESSFTQVKHHWWWKANEVFDHLEITQNVTGAFLFLEDDHYVSPDILSVLKLTQSYIDEGYADFSCLGNHKTLSKNMFIKSSNQAEVLVGQGLPPNIGMTITRKFWRKIHSFSKQFCEYDDYNWDWSLNYLSQEIFPQQWKILFVKSTRVYHIGKCQGIHHNKSSKCNDSNSYLKYQQILNYSKDYLFPPNLSVKVDDLQNMIEKKTVLPYGGWADPRDQILCKNIASNFGNGKEDIILKLAANALDLK